MTDWHSKTCSRLDAAQVGGIITCLSCGSYQEVEDIKEVEFNYPPIKQRTDLRLLWLKPGDFDSTIHCDIFISNVLDADYEAISYTWGDEFGDKSLCKTIILNQAPFDVTRNCEMALKRVRRRFSNRCIWIDAVCIDQKNLDERGHQVQLMPEIYSRANRVLIYVGESANGSSSFLASILDNHTRRLDLLAAEEALGHFLHRNYFQRVWVLQEIALAKKADVICGDIVVPLQSLQPQRLTSLKLLKDSTTQLNGCRVPPALQFTSRIYTQPEQFLRLLDFASNSLAENPRDKVYSLLGLLPGARNQELIVDYRLTIEEVYTRTAIFLGQNYGWGPVFDEAMTREGPTNDLPSWAPDWRTGRLYNIGDARDQSQEPSLEPLPICTDSRTISFRAIDGGWFNGESARLYHILDRQGANANFVDRNLYFDIRSPLLAFLHDKVDGWKNIKTRALLLSETLNSQDPYPALNIKKKLYKSHASACVPSVSWSFISTSKIAKLLDLTVNELVEIMRLLISDWTLNSELKQENKVYEILHELQELQAGDGENQCSLDGSPVPRETLSEMALKLLIETHEEQTICVA